MFSYQRMNCSVVAGIKIDNFSLWDLLYRSCAKWLPPAMCLMKWLTLQWFEAEDELQTNTNECFKTLLAVLFDSIINNLVP